MKGYLSLDEMIAITEQKIKGTVYELLGTEKFLQKALDNADIRPIYRFTGYLVTQCRLDTDFWKNHDNIQNIWFVDGYFKDDQYLYVDMDKEHLSDHIKCSSFRNLDNSRFILKFNTGEVYKLISSKYLGNYDVELLNRVNSEGEVYLTGWHATLFNEKPAYQGTFGYEGMRDTIVIQRDKVYISIEELSKALELDPSAYELTPDTSKDGTDSDNNIIKSITQLEEEIKNLKAELEEANKVIRNQSYLNPANKFFSIEMKLCHDTWNYLYKDGIKPRLAHTREVTTYLENYPDLEVNSKAIKRIATITNPKAVLAKPDPDKED